MVQDRLRVHGTQLGERFPGPPVKGLARVGVRVRFPPRSRVRFSLVQGPVPPGPGSGGQQALRAGASGSGGVSSRGSDEVYRKLQQM